MATAISVSVTVSIAAESRGMFSSIFFVSLVYISTSLGNTFDLLGTSSTSSKVMAVDKILFSIIIKN